MAAFVLLPSEGRPEGAASPPADQIQNPDQEANPYLLPPGADSASSILSIGVPMSAVAPSASAAPKPSSAPPSPNPAATGLPLVHAGSGLCVGFAGTGSEGPLQLQPCTGDASQRWQRLPAGQDTYQFRNAGAGTCLDGTAAGGNTVDVTLCPCRSGRGRASQLWKPEPAGRSEAFRLWFVPPVPKSDDYADHLLGPQNWPKADPPRRGSALVQLPNYYNSANFVFTLG
ncbi:RICIN domain-containing protein [Streptomyces toxytricini]|uniref:RICIN domain-containing protein n=1 Tax=Streptomyces toxytricini TaxID=67369 RepID=A0ABW8EQU1_STRT5